MEEERREINFFRFEGLRLYDKAIDFAKWIHQITEKFPEGEKAELGRRMRIAAQDIALNIAEGAGRGKAQFVYQLKNAKTFIRKVIVLSALSQKLGFITQEEEEECKNYLIEISKMLGALISSLNRSVRNGNSRSNSYNNHNNNNNNNNNNSNYSNNNESETESSMSLEEFEKELDIDND